MRQPDLFAPEPDSDLFGEDRSPILYRADPEIVRLEMRGLLAQAKAASSMPWSHDELRYYQTVFPQMSRWLPDEEARQLRFEFEAELNRLRAA